MSTIGRELEDTLEDAARFYSAAERDLVSELQIAAYGQAACKTAHGNARGLDEPRKIACRGLPFNVGISGKDDLGDARIVQARHELCHMKIIGADTFERRKRSAKHMVTPRKSTRAFYGRDIPRF